MARHTGIIYFFSFKTQKITDSYLSILFRKCLLNVISVGWLGFYSLFFSTPHIILARVPDNLGLKNQLLSPCPPTPNCVSSQEKNSQHRIQPITFEVSLELAKERLQRVINSMHGTRILTQGVLYWHVEFTTQLLRFIDDVEFYFDGSQSLIHLRSASRKGYWDLGVNRRRVETIRAKFEELTN